MANVEKVEKEQFVSDTNTGGCNRVNVRNGMKMVIDDRLQKANQINNDKPLDDLMYYINFEYQNGFTVSLLMGATIDIDGDTYFGKEGIYGIKDEGDLLFVIYREHVTRQWKLYYDEFNLLCDDEKAFYTMIDSLLNEVQVEQV